MLRFHRGKTSTVLDITAKTGSHIYCNDHLDKKFPLVSLLKMTTRDCIPWKHSPVKTLYCRVAHYAKPFTV